MASKSLEPLIVKAEKLLDTARAAHEYPPVPGAIRTKEILAALRNGSPVSAYQIRQRVSGKTDHISRDLCHLAAALLIYAPGTVRIDRESMPGTSIPQKGIYQYLLISA